MLPSIEGCLGHVYVEVCVKLANYLCHPLHTCHMRTDALFDGHRASRVDSWADTTKDWLLRTAHFFMDEPDDAPAAESEVASAAGTGTSWQQTGTGNKVT